MTLICEAKNKAELKAKLDKGCAIRNPTPFGDRIFRSPDLPVGFREPVVLDPTTRRRFATIERKPDGWKVT